MQGLDAPERLLLGITAQDNAGAPEGPGQSGALREPPSLPGGGKCKRESQWNSE